MENEKMNKERGIVALMKIYDAITGGPLSA
jgi:hypothetical protein